MPSRSPDVSAAVAARAGLLGRRIRERRKILGVSATAAAESAGMSRVTWHRIERGELSVTMGAYLAALDVLDLLLSVDLPLTLDGNGRGDESGWLPLQIPLRDYPQLKKLAWQVQGVDTLSPREAWGIYQRNWRHLDVDQLQAHEQLLIDNLRELFREDKNNV